MFSFRPNLVVYTYSDRIPSLKTAPLLLTSVINNNTSTGGSSIDETTNSDNVKYPFIEDRWKMIEIRGPNDNNKIYNENNINNINITENISNENIHPHTHTHINTSVGHHRPLKLVSIGPQACRTPAAVNQMTGLVIPLIHEPTKALREKFNRQVKGIQEKEKFVCFGRLFAGFDMKDTTTHISVGDNIYVTSSQTGSVVQQVEETTKPPPTPVWMVIVTCSLVVCALTLLANPNIADSIGL
eukprot:GHVR01168126.1.p1 GENE.GHVR01168126.1~~GHVR01168126.1.p1  ORF type:complete len:242 (+),score=74.23 GHVR01168126.1:120-845(+)